LIAETGTRAENGNGWNGPGCWVIGTLAHWDTNFENIPDICMFVIMRKWTCIESNIWVMKEYGFFMISAWRNHNKKLPSDSGGATRIGSFVRGGHETGGAGVWFSLLFALIQFKILLVNAITINIVFNVNKV
jgi:hypothetical protein